MAENGLSQIGGRLPERLKGTDCKSVGYAYVGSNPTPPMDSFDWPVEWPVGRNEIWRGESGIRGDSQVAGVRMGLIFAGVAQW